ncbi:potassium uptake protein [Azorhizobium caulinodans ORS 571]|uniref:Probable potassium transport system protein Kup n=1 Tax=Azorhizobium caulinodans (strain ATCC 43989 / DSM 5975 / JCM 20966 / LMG 6465 / NBRC 14845 / NCIMB 13405 / ORS 571) TaxID=438753 RepID=KUP_AZOC5|nr:KUP/HAK/KT family potassium transporter [Azorhizobium caulinodans]A8ILJ2.2 RecName: Full=Probable potassium transport system protein Kup [Azorhizobium caulinodans ORS 571]BAF90039.2 potassium uptake protein [Azorhizobium caulinodans ORS 571]
MALSFSRDRSRALPLAAEIGALGVVFGDIGTSPLYALKQGVLAVGGTDFTSADVMGLLSLITWSIILSVTVKYVMLVLRADNDGEGGILALVTLLDLHRSAIGLRWYLLAAGLVGAAMLIGDGVLTPAMSVLSAIEGLQVISPALLDWIVPLTVLVLAAVFLSQRLGTERIASFYGPIMVLWFGSLAVLGVYGIMQAPEVLAGLDPRAGFHTVTTHPGLAGVIIGACFLAITGGEALYADLGHFGRKTIARAWLFVAMPALLLNYFGQGAILLRDPQAVRNPFYDLCPDLFDIPLLFLATAATVIASQSIITGVFSLAKQAIELGYLPPMRIRYTSEHNEQHIYVGRLNWLLMVACIAVVLGFEASDRLASAYGIAVAFAMVTTSILFVAQVNRAWKWPKPAVIALGIGLFSLDAAFASANLTKLHEGGWLPLTIAGIVIFVMVSWRRGLEGVVAQQQRFTEPLDEFVLRGDRASDAESPRTAIFLSRAGAMTPVALSRMADLLKVRFQRAVIVSVWIAARPRVSVDDRVRVTNLDGGFIRVDLRFGYMQQIDVPSVLGPALSARGVDPDEAIYVIGHERIIPPDEVVRGRDVVAHVFAFLARNAERSVDRFGLPRSRTVEIGYPVKL